MKGWVPSPQCVFKISQAKWFKVNEVGEVRTSKTCSQCMHAHSVKRDDRG